ncbi:hypothetical protein GRI40_09005 [Altererythrobacter aerius]|uniref:Uncharacterized protein n=1 Tax=Tsuneonella aeria TaxID=1837929 RepID=A0A6I4TH54_9SPHN|nr:hypothetical protein [Tsuneonella aeria]MXO75350.1 hypothetical protein [Tsuneonella aeria]
MRFHYTLAFSEAKSEYEAAMREYATFDENDDGAEDRAGKRLDAADAVFWSTPAYTPMELITKMVANDSRGAGLDNGFLTTDQICADLHRMQRCASSQPIQERFDAWRAGEVRLEAAQEQEDIDAACNASVELYQALAETPCTTPGDFIIKQYIRLRSTNGHWCVTSTKKAGTANLWDIQVDDHEHEATLETIDKQTTYRDIADTDIGRNLLAYGRTDFDPEAWMETADRIGFKVGLHQQQDGSWGFGWPCTSDGDPDPRLRRERDRLMEIVNFPFDGDKSRIRALADVIRLRWPQLMYSNPLAPAEEMEAA